MNVAIATRTNVVDHATVCDCGQDLDCCTREHCPRCGCQVRSRS